MPTAQSCAAAISGLVLLCGTCLAQSDATPVATPQASATAPAASSSKVSAEVDFAAYFWAPSIGGSSGVNGSSVDIDLSFLDLFNDTDRLYGFMGHAELNINRFLLLLDPVWTHMEKNDAVKDAPTETDVSVNTLWFDMNAGYRFIDHAPIGGDESKVSFSLDGLVGARVSQFKFELQPTGDPSVSARRTWIDPIVGGRAEFGLGEHVGLVFRGDVGGFGAGSEFSANMVAAVGYRFPLGEADGAVFLGFRALYQDYDRDNFEWRAWVYGPMIGFQISF